jgi:hypothetical protein
MEIVIIVRQDFANGAVEVAASDGTFHRHGPSVVGSLCFRGFCCNKASWFSELRCLANSEQGNAWRIVQLGVRINGSISQILFLSRAVEQL